MAQLKDTEVSGNLTVSGSIKKNGKEVGTEEKENSISSSLNSEIATASSHRSNKSNPHGVTKAQVGLGSVEDYNLESIIKATLLRAHPIGSYYWTSSSENPSTTFGGTWERIEDKFIYAAKATDKKVGLTGGAVSHKIGTANLPQHTHDMTHYHNRGDMNITGNQTYKSRNNSIISNSVWWEISGMQQENDNAFYLKSYSGVCANMWVDEGKYPKYEIAFDAKRSWTGVTSGPQSNKDSARPTYITSTGNGGFANTALDTMPPYITAYCWKRTA